MEIIWPARILKAFSRLPATRRHALTARLKTVAANPQGRHGFAAALTGHADTFRIRSGDWRLVYELDTAAATLNVVSVGHRRDIYRSL